MYILAIVKVCDHCRGRIRRIKSLRRIGEHGNDIIWQVDGGPLLMNPTRPFIKILIALPQAREEVAVGHIMLKSPLKTYEHPLLKAENIKYRSLPNQLTSHSEKSTTFKKNVAEITATSIME